jgi:alanyl-tRNA synthetase
LLKAPAHELTGKLGQMLESVRSLEKELARLKSKLAASAGDDLASQAQQVSGIALLATTVDADAAAMREMLDKLKDKLKSAAIVLASVDGDKVSLIAGVTSDLTSKVKAGELVTHVAGQIGGKGGGRPDMAQGGGTNPAALPAALQSLSALVAQKLG